MIEALPIIHSKRFIDTPAFIVPGISVLECPDFERNSGEGTERDTEDVFYFERAEPKPSLVERVLEITMPPSGIGRQAVEEGYKKVVDPSNINGGLVTPFSSHDIVIFIDTSFPYNYVQIKRVAHLGVSSYTREIVYARYAGHSIMMLYLSEQQYTSYIGEEAEDADLYSAPAETRYSGVILARLSDVCKDRRDSFRAYELVMPKVETYSQLRVPEIHQLMEDTLFDFYQHYQAQVQSLDQPVVLAETRSNLQLNIPLDISLLASADKINIPEYTQGYDVIFTQQAPPKYTDPTNEVDSLFIPAESEPQIQQIIPDLCSDLSMVSLFSLNNRIVLPLEHTALYTNFIVANHDGNAVAYTDPANTFTIDNLITHALEPQLQTQIFEAPQLRINTSLIISPDTIVPLSYTADYTLPIVKTDANTSTYTKPANTLEQPITPVKAETYLQPDIIETTTTRLPIEDLVFASADNITIPLYNLDGTNTIVTESNTNTFANYEDPSVQVKDGFSLQPNIQSSLKNIEIIGVDAIPYISSVLNTLESTNSNETSFKYINNATPNTDLPTSIDFGSIIQTQTQQNSLSESRYDFTYYIESNTESKDTSVSNNSDLSISWVLFQGLEQSSMPTQSESQTGHNFLDSMVIEPPENDSGGEFLTGRFKTIEDKTTYRKPILEASNPLDDYVGYDEAIKKIEPLTSKRNTGPCLLDVESPYLLAAKKFAGERDKTKYPCGGACYEDFHNVLYNIRTFIDDRGKRWEGVYRIDCMDEKGDIFTLEPYIENGKPTHFYKAFEFVITEEDLREANNLSDIIQNRLKKINLSYVIETQEYTDLITGKIMSNDLLKAIAPMHRIAKYLLGEDLGILTLVNGREPRNGSSPIRPANNEVKSTAELLGQKVTGIYAPLGYMLDSLN